MCLVMNELEAIAEEDIGHVVDPIDGEVVIEGEFSCARVDEELLLGLFYVVAIGMGPG